MQTAVAEMARQNDPMENRAYLHHVEVGQEPARCSRNQNHGQNRKIETHGRLRGSEGYPLALVMRSGHCQCHHDRKHASDQFCRAPCLGFYVSNETQLASDGSARRLTYPSR